MNRTCEWYWGNICKVLHDEGRRKKIKSRETLFYRTRKERLEKSCAEHASFVQKVLADLSSYIHSVPPSLWLKSLDEAFIDNSTTRGILAIWLRIANFFYARSIDIIITAVNLNKSDQKLEQYIETYRKVLDS